jgi:hypothetical protein
MTQLFTPEDVILHLYDEAPPTERQALNEALREDYLLREEYEALQQARRKLPRVRFDAPATRLQAILAYSKRTRKDG